MDEISNTCHAQSLPPYADSNSLPMGRGEEGLAMLGEGGLVVSEVAADWTQKIQVPP